MGIYDREYYREEPGGFSLAAPRSAIGVLVLINVAVYLVEMFASTPRALGNPVVDYFGAWLSSLPQPWMWYQFLTYGFVHSPADITHILFNMMGLWFLGRDVEQWYGTREFTRLYLALVVFSGFFWAVCTRIAGGADIEMAHAIGASGAVVGVTILYAMLFPRRMILFMFVLPMPAWVLGIIVVASDVLGATGWTTAAGKVAFTAHLGGAALAFLYFRQQWNFGRLMPGKFRWPRWKGPRLRVHHADEEDDAAVREEELDRILDKIHREGRGSLTSKERRLLETASREFQRRRSQG